MRQYHVVYEKMIDENNKLFDEFFRIHELYILNPQMYHTSFNEIGKRVQDVIHDYERRLCGKTEGGQYSKFSMKLSEKFWEIIRKDFPKIDYIGLK